MGVRRRTSQRQQQQRAAKAGREPAAAPAPAAGGPTKASRGGGNDVPNLLPDFEEVFSSVESLYADELKPFGRILRKRVAERAAAAGKHGILTPWVPGSEENLPDVDIKHLRATCEASDVLRVEPEEGGDWSALIVERPEAFVNVYSPVDMYPAEMWEAASGYFTVLDGEDMYLPGGRYSCAQALQARGLGFLLGRSLGQVCHIVQLAISQKKILGYLNGAVVPYASSQSMVKEQCAQFNAPCTAATQAVALNSGTAAMPMATWERARACLREILDTSAKSEPDAVGMVPLSNVKRLFRSRFHVELSETMLGHSKLSELLQDERFGDICTVQLQGHGYIVVQVPPAEHPNPRGIEVCLADSLPLHGGDAPRPQGADEPRRVASSLAEAPGFCVDEPLDLAFGEDGVVECSPSPKSPGIRRWPSFSPHNGGYGVSGLVQRTFIHASPPPPTPPPNARRRSHSLPKDVGSDKGYWGAQCLPLGFMQQPLGNQPELTESTIDSATGSAAGAPPPSSPAPSCELQSCGTDGSPGHASDDPVKVLLRECNFSAAAAEPVKIGEPAIELPGMPDFHAWALADVAEEAEPRRRLQFCPDEPLALEEAGVFLEHAPRSQTPTSGGLTVRSVPGASPRWPCFSPSVLVKDGCVGSIALSKVQNTFIHSPLPPPTPLRVGAARRARSLPKNVGSDKNAWEATCQALGAAPHQMRRMQLDREFSAGDCGPTPSVWGGDCGPTPSVYGGGCGPTPSVYADYTGPDMPCSLASSPAFVPPSPALTASPTYCGSRAAAAAQRQLLLASSTGPPSPLSGRATPASPGGRQNPAAAVISLADLLQ